MEIMETYRQGGYPAVEKLFRKRLGFKLLFLAIKSKVSAGIKTKIKTVLG